MNRLIVFCLYGNNPIYLDGAIRNSRDACEFYPGWISRFYIDDTVPSDIIKILKEKSEVILMPRSEGSLGMWWRFEPFKDDTIERFISRDVDSKIIKKEVSAVNEWIESGKEFHIMRDHKYHVQPIMGGMWGASKEFIDKEKNVFEEEKNKFLSSLSSTEIYHSSGKYYQTDQAFLKKFIWPKIINKHIAHIANLDSLRFTGDEKLFPLEDDDGYFVAYQYYLKNEPNYFKNRL